MKWYDETDTAYYAALFNFSPQDIAGHTHFWKEPAVEPVQGRETVFFRIGRYVGWYKVYMSEPDYFEGEYIISPELPDLLYRAVQMTIPKLRSL